VGRVGRTAHKGRRLSAIALLLLLVGSVPALAERQPEAPRGMDKEPMVPPGFKVRASDGYTLSAIALRGRRTDRDFVLLIMSSRHASVAYFAPGTVGPTSIKADLGAIGQINVHFVSSGSSRIERSSCGGEPVLVDAGTYEGSIDLEGEEGYSQVHAISGDGEVKALLDLLCAGGTRSEGIGGHSPGARLTVRHHGARQFEFEAMKNSPTRPARFAASVSERRGRLLISREVRAVAASSSFDFDVSTGTAHVSPPAPFAGEGSYRRPRDKDVRWHGGLSVDFPGRSNVRLTGDGTRASLVRAVLNPSHPFRVR
jgi:hypothetical protein